MCIVCIKLLKFLEVWCVVFIIIFIELVGIFIGFWFVILIKFNFLEFEIDVFILNIDNVFNNWLLCLVIEYKFCLICFFKIWKKLFLSILGICNFFCLLYWFVVLLIISILIFGIELCVVFIIILI